MAQGTKKKEYGFGTTIRAGCFGGVKKAAFWE